MTIHTLLPAASVLAVIEIDEQSLILIGLVIFIGTLMIRRMRTRRRTSGVDARTTAQARVHNNRLNTQARDDINELMLRLEELSREICGQIDTRFAKLQHAIREADIKLAALRAAEAQAGAAPADTERAALLEPTDPKHADIWTRAQQGQTDLMIARELEMPIGEIQLILSLERSRRGSPTPVAIEPADDPAPEPTPEPPKGLRLDERA